jgi:hypothetical protein
LWVCFEKHFPNDAEHAMRAARQRGNTNSATEAYRYW